MHQVAVLFQVYACRCRSDCPILPTSHTHVAPVPLLYRSQQVREYDVVDAVPYAVDFTWDKEGAPTTQTVFDKYSAFPSTKAITFMRSEPFTVAASYAEDPSLPASVPRQLGSYTIGPFTVSAKGVSGVWLVCRGEMGPNRLKGQRQPLV